MKTKLIITILLSIFPFAAFAVNYSQDTGKITNLYASQSGSIAIQLDAGFQNANAASQCPTNSGFAGNIQPSNLLKAVLLIAKTTGATIVVTTLGCESNGSWLKIIDVYIK